MKRLIMDLDDTLTRNYDGSYQDVLPNEPVIARLREYKEKGFEIVINTSRNMRTYSGNIGLINANTLPVILKWLGKHNVPYDEIYTGKPWCGEQGFYVDDKSIRPSEFALLDYEEIVELLSLEKKR